MFAIGAKMEIICQCQRWRRIHGGTDRGGRVADARSEHTKPAYDPVLDEFYSVKMLILRGCAAGRVSQRRANSACFDVRNGLTS